MDYKKLLPKNHRSRLPRHIGIIMDGNGRWAKKRLLPRLQGHSAGAKSIREVTELAVELGLERLTFYAFSTENWSRPQDEVQGLLKLLKERLIKEIPELNEQNIHVRFIGSEQGLDPQYLQDIRKVAAMTDGNTGLKVNIAFNYGGRAEIVDAARAIAEAAVRGELDPSRLTEDRFRKFLDEPEIPDVDLFVRSSGEQRTSNFLLWQSAYAEMVFLDRLWPDFDRRDLWQAIETFARRDRRYGGAVPNPVG